MQTNSENGPPSKTPLSGVEDRPAGISRRTQRNSGGRPALIRATHPIHPLIRWAFAVFVFSIPFETVSHGFSKFSLSKVLGYAFFLLTLLQPRACFRRIPISMLCFGAYLFVYWVFGSLVNSYYPSQVTSMLFTLMQMLVLFWVSYNLLRQPRMLTFCIGAWAAACSILAALQFFGVTKVTYHGQEGRMSALNENPNTVGGILALGLIALVGLVYGRTRTTSLFRYIVWGMLPIVAIGIVNTGSRGAFVALAFGLLVFVLSTGSAWIKIRHGFVVLMAFVILMATTLTSQNSVARWKLTLKQKSMAGREDIFPQAWKMLFEKPLMGWGPVKHYYELGWRMGLETKDTHNLVLWVLTEVGLVGSIPFFAGLYLCVRSAWRARNGPLGVLPLALTVTLLICNMSGTYLNLKVHWLLLAYASASGVQVLSMSGQRPLLSRISRGYHPPPGVRLNWVKG